MESRLIDIVEDRLKIGQLSKSKLRFWFTQASELDKIRNKVGQAVKSGTKLNVITSGNTKYL